MFMQAAPGYIDSFADFFVTDARLIGTETTIGGFNQLRRDEGAGVLASPQCDAVRGRPG